MKGFAKRRALLRIFRFLSVIAALFAVYVLLDFAIDFRPAGIHDSYRLQVEELAEDEARILRSDNLAILVVRRSAATIASLGQTTGLQDPMSRRSSQPEFAANPLRSKTPEYFVAYAIGTDFGCALEILDSGVKEICSDASYDFAGRALEGERQFENLPVPDYNFSDDFSQLTVRP